ncbi:O-antigen ligase family protein [Mesorhizobium sp.]|uniref:O-antigen ligase family protein n=1 Tax=Mesorhizobium sp. TaxID=1871066 RepID=UPI001223EF86|nr:O-antigen ligase family protein [Mesorhizobium sp.]TIT03038.1 MAG: O-antigen ligase family protein [Mesorhizobium sp.]
MHVSKPVLIYKDLWAWSFALAVAGYPLVGLLSSVTGREDERLSIAFRILVVCLCGLSFLLSDRQKAWRFGDVSLFSFVGLYVLKLGIDAYEIDKASDDLVFAAITSIVPAAFLALSTNRWSEINVAWALFAVGALSVAGVVWLQYSGSNTVLLDNTDRVYFERLNPISIGHAGVTTLIASYTLARISQRKVLKTAIVAVVVTSAVAIYLAAARGPIVALACCAILLPMLRPKFTTMIMCLLFLAGAVLVLAVTDITPLLDKFHLTAIGKDTSTTSRLGSIALSWELFQQNPLFGYGTQLPLYGYPHNMFMEILQTMGLLGMAIFVPVFVKIAMAVKFLADKRLVLLPLLTTQAIVGAQFSGSLWGAAFLWIVVTVMIFRVNAMRSFDLWAHRRMMWRSYAQFGAPSRVR